MRRTVYKNDKYIANYNNTPGVDELECVEMNYCLVDYNKINENIEIGSCGGDIMGLKIKNCMKDGFDYNLIIAAIKAFKFGSLNIVKNSKNLAALNEVAKHAIDNMKKEEVIV